MSDDSIQFEKTDPEGTIRFRWNPMADTTPRCDELHDLLLQAGYTPVGWLNIYWPPKAFIKMSELVGDELIDDVSSAGFCPQQKLSTIQGTVSFGKVRR